MAQFRNKKGPIKTFFLPGAPFSIMLYGIVIMMTMMLISDAIFVTFGDMHDNETMTILFE
jgi:hypothetical protein